MNLDEDVFHGFKSVHNYLSDKSRGGGGIILPGWGQHAFLLVVP